MRFSSVLVALYATLTSACIFPFNNPHLANDSSIEEYVAHLQVKYGDTSEDSGGSGWTTIIGQGTTDTIAWPDDAAYNTKLTSIYYCFASHNDFTALEDLVNEAAVMWMNKLGPGHSNGHRFDNFHHYFDRKSNRHPRCYEDYTDRKNRKWNKNVPEGTLVIESIAPIIGSWATLGYRDKTVDSAPDRHRLYIGKKGPSSDTEIAHELGHVLGLVHEHQRKDRDQYVKYDCSKLARYDEVKSKIESHKEWKISIDDVCKSNYLGWTHGLNWGVPSQYSLDMGSCGQTIGKTYDYKSIMQYTSGDYAVNDATTSVKDLPFVRWKNGRPKDDVVDGSNAEYIYLNRQPSDGDKEGIQDLYPWLGW